MQAEQAMAGPCRQATARLGLGFGFMVGFRMHACSSGGWMQAMPGPCRQATARPGLAFGLTLGLRMHACSSGGVDAGRAGHASAMQAGFS